MSKIIQFPTKPNVEEKQVDAQALLSSVKELLSQFPMRMIILALFQLSVVEENSSDAELIKPSFQKVTGLPITE